jgi:hypothetical protein
MNKLTTFIATSILTAFITLGVQTNVSAQQYLLNEVEIDPPSTISNACQFAEIRVVNPSGAVPANTYFLSVNSDGGNFGFANQAINFGGQTVGSNGTITLFNNGSLACPNRTYGLGTTFLSYFSPLAIGTGSETYLVVRSTSTLFSGQDLDTDDDGLFDAGLGITILDGFASIVNPKEEYVYGAEFGVVNISNTISLDQPDAVTRFPNNTTPYLTNGDAFYFGELSASPDETTQYAAPLSSNFPVGGQLTPGNLNGSAPTAAAVTVSGRVSSGFRGVAGAIVVMTDNMGNSRIVRTNPFGYFSFLEVAAGETYVFNVKSKRYIFDSRVINIDDDLTDLIFTPSQNGIKQSLNSKG